MACKENQLNFEGRFASLSKMMKHKEASSFRVEEARKGPERHRCEETALEL